MTLLMKEDSFNSSTNRGSVIPIYTEAERAFDENEEMINRNKHLEPLFSLIANNFSRGIQQ